MKVIRCLTRSRRGSNVLQAGRGEDKIWQQANAAKLRKFQILDNLDFRQKGGGFVEVCPLVGGSSFYHEGSTTVLLWWIGEWVFVLP